MCDDKREAGQLLSFAVMIAGLSCLPRQCLLRDAALSCSTPQPDSFPRSAANPSTSKIRLYAEYVSNLVPPVLRAHPWPPPQLRCLAHPSCVSACHPPGPQIRNTTRIAYGSRYLFRSLFPDP